MTLRVHRVACDVSGWMPAPTASAAMRDRIAATAASPGRCPPCARCERDVRRLTACPGVVVSGTSVIHAEVDRARVDLPGEARVSRDSRAARAHRARRGAVQSKMGISSRDRMPASIAGFVSNEELYSRGIVVSHAPESCVECSRIACSQTVGPNTVLRARRPHQPREHLRHPVLEVAPRHPRRELRQLSQGPLPNRRVRCRMFVKGSGCRAIAGLASATSERSRLMPRAASIARASKTDAAYGKECFGWSSAWNTRSHSHQRAPPHAHKCRVLIPPRCWNASR